jgi:HSP20 family protein
MYLPTVRSNDFQTLLWGSDTDFINLVDRMFEDFHFMDFSEIVKKDTYPISNIYVGEDQSIKITIAVTDWDKKDISISSEDDSIIIVGKDNREEDKKWRLINGKIKKNSFSKRIRLSNRLDYDKAEASIENGLLTIIIPPKDELKPKTIEIL